MDLYEAIANRRDVRREFTGGTIDPEVIRRILTAGGIGVGWVSFYREAFLRDPLGIPAHVRPVAWLCRQRLTNEE